MQSTRRMNRRPSVMWIAVIVVVFAVAAGSCKGARPVAPQAAAAAESVAVHGTEALLKGPGEATIGDRTTCAMHKGATFTVAATTPKVEYGGRTYYFCCEVCAKKFADHPTEYIR